jgi:hypothetical protein
MPKMLCLGIAFNPAKPYARKPDVGQIATQIVNNAASNASILNQCRCHKKAYESFGGMLDASFAYSLSAIVSTINLINSCAFVLNPDSTILSLLLNSDSLRYDSQFFCQP